MQKKDLFKRGFYISSKALEINVPGVSDWNSINIDGFFFGHHEKCNFFHSKNNGYSKYSHVFFGYPTDIDNPEYSPETIGEFSLYTLIEHGFEAYEKYIAYLGGRFLSVLINSKESQVVIHPDCHATYSCYYHRHGEDIVFSSHVNLLQQMFDLKIDETAAEIRKSKNYIAPGGKYNPGLLTPYENICLVFPNCKAEFNNIEKKFSHKRFYPFVSEGKVVNNNRCASDFPDLFEAHIKSIVKDNEFYISLTAGLDSRATFFASKNVSNINNIKSFTYFRGEKSSPSMIKDLVVASNLAFSICVPHKAVLVKDISYSSDFHKFYSEVFRRCARFPSLARAYNEELPHDILSLISTCSETGMAFYKKRDEKVITAELLARLYTPSSINKEKVVIDCFEDYISYVEFNSDRLGWLDPYDAFYWEHRNGKWASLWYSEADLSHFSVVPYNQRGVIEAMLSAPLVDRKEKRLIIDYISKNSF